MVKKRDVCDASATCVLFSSQYIFLNAIEKYISVSYITEYAELLVTGLNAKKCVMSVKWHIPRNTLRKNYNNS